MRPSRLRRPPDRPSIPWSAIGWATLAALTSAGLTVAAQCTHRSFCALSGVAYASPEWNNEGNFRYNYFGSRYVSVSCDDDGNTGCCWAHDIRLEQYNGATGKWGLVAARTGGFDVIGGLDCTGGTVDDACSWNTTGGLSFGGRYRFVSRLREGCPPMSGPPLYAYKCRWELQFTVPNGPPE